MLETYLHRLDELLSTSVLVHDVEIVRMAPPRARLPVVMKTLVSSESSST